MEETVDELFPITPADVRAILTEIRRMVRATLPDATEIIYHGALAYQPDVSRFDPIVYVAPQNGYVNLGFYYGVGVPDPAGLLEGVGKRMRHTKVRSIQAAQNAALVPLVLEVWRHGILAIQQRREARNKRRVGLPER